MLAWLLPALLVSACARDSTLESTRMPPGRRVSPTHAEAGAWRFVDAIRRNEKATVRGMFAAFVRISRVELVSDPCRAEFGQDQTVTGDRLDLLAACLVELDRDSVNPQDAVGTRLDGRWLVDLSTQCASYRLELTQPDGVRFAVVALTASSKCGSRKDPPAF